MAKITRNLFSWQEIDAESDLSRLELVLSVIPDEALMVKLEAKRKHGRNDYPIRPMWNALIAGIVYQHPSIESLRRELARNAELRQVCGFDPFRGADAVPPAEAFTRFRRSFEGLGDEIEGIFEELVGRLGEVLPDLGKRLAMDSKAIQSYGKPTKKTEVDGRRDLDARWGTKTYTGVRGNGEIWKKVTHWYGYKLHLLVDSEYELPIGYTVTSGAESDVTQMMPMLDDYSKRHESIARRAQYLTADKGYDSTELIRDVYDRHGIHPIIDIRNCWRSEGNEGLEQPNEPTTRQFHAYDGDNIVHDYRGTVYCYCMKTRTHQAMAFGGYDKRRRSLKYLCPMKHYGMSCASQSECRHCGKSVWIPLTENRRMFTSVARSSYKWAREYRYRSAVERVNSRLDRSYGFEEHTIRGMKKMKTRICLAMIVMLSMALGHIKAKREDMMRSLVKRAPPPQQKAA